jgi:hypothetical protein
MTYFDKNRLYVSQNKHKIGPYFYGIFIPITSYKLLADKTQAQY